MDNLRFFKVLFVALFMGCSGSDDGMRTDDIGRDPQLETVEAKAMVHQNNAFALNFFKELSYLEEADNYMVSPLSLSLALGMTYNGADGATAAAIGEVLGHGEVDRANAFNGNLIRSLTANGSGALLEMAHAIWIQDNFPIVQEFVATNETFYDAEVGNLDFGDPKSAEAVNQWASEHTHGKIEEFVDAFDPSTVLFLANALYFKGSWKFEFDPEDTRPAPFETAEGPIEVPMMSMTAEVPFLKAEAFSSILLPYRNERFQMAVFLPEVGTSTDMLIESMSVDVLADWLDSYHVSEVAIGLPKFTASYESMLNEVLTNMGLGIAFSSQADFSGIHGEASLQISRVLQKTFIEVNEEGTEAAAVTGVEIVETSAPLVQTFIADRPFVYMIRDSYTGSICFMGRLGAP